MPTHLRDKNPSRRSNGQMKGPPTRRRWSHNWQIQVVPPLVKSGQTGPHTHGRATLVFAIEEATLRDETEIHSSRFSDKGHYPREG